MDYKTLAEELVRYQFNLSKVPKERGMNSFEQARGEKSVVGYLMEVKDGAAPSQIAEFMGVSTARMACILNSLEKKAYILRKSDASDKRKINVYITEEGKIMGMKYRLIAIEKLSNLLAELGEHDAKEYVRIMEKIYRISLVHRND